MVGKLKPLIDADLLRYEVGFGVERKDENGEPQLLSFDAAITLLERRVEEIVGETWATEPPTFYLTADEKLISRLNKRRVKRRAAPLEYKPNFREAAAVTKPYKGNRSGDRPRHYDSLTAYMLSEYDVELAIGIEADDLISIHHNLPNKDYKTILCSRDKDLLITPGLHFSWSFMKSPSALFEVDVLGTLERSDSGKVTGSGLKFFYSQLLTGDVTDNIPGLPKKGPVFAYNALKDCESEEELFREVSKEYKQVMKDHWRTYFKEQAALLWIIQKLDEQGQPVHYTMFDER